MKKKIVMTGGGTAGHVTPNIALFPTLQKMGYEISYIGSYNGIEKGLIEECSIPYYGISSGKLRRYFDVKNFTDPFRVLKGYGEAKKIIKKIQPDVIFSKGGFVSVPVIYAARKYGIPAVIHEADLTPGLANRLCIPYASKICCNFPETLEYLPKEKAVLTGCPVRAELFTGDAKKALDFTGLGCGRPVILVMGGSLGAAAVNEAVRTVLPSLLSDFNVIHLCGKGKTDPSLNALAGYVQYEYIDKELKDLFAAADIVVSRAGANAVFELLALRKPSLLIPLPSSSSRGDQLLNARSFEKQGFCRVLEEEEITPDKLLSEITLLYNTRDRLKETMSSSPQTDPVGTITRLIEEAAQSSAS